MNVPACVNVILIINKTQTVAAEVTTSYLFNKQDGTQNNQRLLNVAYSKIQLVMCSE